MRLAWLCLLVVGCRADEGAQLTLRAPAGPASAASFQVVLATPATEPVVPGQRAAPGSLATESVTYYLQATAAGVTPDHTAIARVDGFTVRVAPDASVAQTAFVPFVVLLDDAGAPVGLGTFHADPTTPTPSPILVQAGEIDQYTIDVEPVTAVDGEHALARGDALAVECARSDQSMFESGVAWRPDEGPELRILLPDDPGGTDATMRDLDLDCDGHAVTASDSSEDCDDTSSLFYRGAPETCDGLDTNCDGQSLLAVACTPQPSTGVCADPQTGQGIALCDDTTGTVGTCQGDPACLCANGATTGCTRCVISHEMPVAAGTITPCQPGIGTLMTLGVCEAGPCEVEVLAVHGGWEAQVAADQQSSFGPTATGVTGSFALRARRPEGPGAAIPGDPGHRTGEVDLAIVDSAGVPHLVGVDLELAGDTPTTCQGSGPFPMQCSP